jgi:hypothetical protein
MMRSIFAGLILVSREKVDIYGYMLTIEIDCMQRHCACWKRNKFVSNSTDGNEDIIVSGKTEFCERQFLRVLSCTKVCGRV